MAGLFAISINSKQYKGNFGNDSFEGIFYQQHMGEEFAGLAVYDNGHISTESYSGLIQSNFDRTKIEGTELIAYCGDSSQPFEGYFKWGKYAICFSGNILNFLELSKKYQSRGHIVSAGSEVELISMVIAQGENIEQGIGRLFEGIEGAFSVLLLSEEGIYAITSGHWPLVIGTKEGACVIAVDPCGFPNLGIQTTFIVPPGQVISINNGKPNLKLRTYEAKGRMCSFLWVYTAFPCAVYRNLPASSARKQLGARLAMQDIAEGFIPDIVAPIPDSGRFHGIGYHQEFCRAINAKEIARVPFYDEVLLKNPFAGRSFTLLSPTLRALKADIKQLPSGETFKDLILVVTDDSIVRGTQTKNKLVPKLWSLGFAEIHLRISEPLLFSHCKWGKTTKKGEMLAASMPVDEMAEHLGVNSIRFSSIPALLSVIGLPKEEICFDCCLK